MDESGFFLCLDNSSARIYWCPGTLDVTFLLVCVNFWLLLMGSKVQVPSSSFFERLIHWYLIFGNTLRLLQWDSVFLQWDKVTLKFFWVVSSFFVMEMFRFGSSSTVQSGDWFWGKKDSCSSLVVDARSDSSLTVLSVSSLVSYITRLLLSEGLFVV